jgi:cell fate (sporulation/competence/biofilm development) regulator YlbF (YheA/YmcA/DUF963 family)
MTMEGPDSLKERARELGRILGQGNEYRALASARDRLSADRECVTAFNRLASLEETVAASLDRGEEPPADLRDEYERLFSELQGSPVYQAVVAAQANFDKVLARVNEEILAGIEAGARSRIILPT